MNSVGDGASSNGGANAEADDQRDVIDNSLLDVMSGDLHLDGDAPKNGPGEREIFVAIVSPVGGPVGTTVSALEDAFASHQYATQAVRISKLLDKAFLAPSDKKASNRIRRLMNKGDAFRARIDDQAACAYAAALAISRARTAEEGSSTKHRARHVNIIRSLKTPQEVQALRAIYGQRLVVLGVSASIEERRRELARLLAKELPKDEIDEEVAALLARDAKDEREKHGQRSSEAYALADAFVAATTKSETAAVRRLVELLLGEPFHTPTPDEQGMFHAWAAKYRSSAAGRQVGAAITNSEGELVVVGCNDVPKPGGGQYWPSDTTDRRDFQLGFDANDRHKFTMAANILRELAEKGWLVDAFKKLPYDQRAERALEADGPLKRSELSDLVEYGRIVHAEMAALMTAAREGRSVRGCTLYTTTYPCHECARLIIAAGITRVVYIDPYAKSRTPVLFEEMIDSSGLDGRVKIEPFVGVSPRLFRRVFDISNRTKNIQGNYDAWGSERKLLAVSDEEFTDSIPEQEKAVARYLKRLLATKPTENVGADPDD